MKKWLVLFQTEAVLYCRDVFGAFFTFAFPVLMLVLFGSIYGNAPTAYFDGLGSIDVSVPAYCAMILAVVGIMAFPLTLAQYKERKIYKRFDATPLGKGAVIVVQGAVSFTMAVLGFLLLFAVGFGVYGLRVDGSWVLIAALLLLCMASIFALGFFFTAIAPTERICQLLCYIAYFLMLSSLRRFVSTGNAAGGRAQDFRLFTAYTRGECAARCVSRRAMGRIPGQRFRPVRRGTRLRPGRRAAIPQKKLGVNLCNAG